MPPAIPPYIELSVLLDRRLPPAAGLGEEEADLVLGEDGGEFVGGVVGARAGASVPRAAVAAVEAAVLAIAWLPVIMPNGFVPWGAFHGKDLKF